jgi:hypothetical protein
MPAMSSIHEHERSRPGTIHEAMSDLARLPEALTAFVASDNRYCAEM